MKYFLILFILISIVGCSKNDSDKSSSSESNEQDNSSSVDNGQDNSSTLDYAAAPTPVEGALTGTAALGASKHAWRNIFPSCSGCGMTKVFGPPRAWLI